MGFFGFFSSQSPQEKAAEEVRSGARTPSRKERELCWAARDVYFSCLDAQGVIDAVNEPGKSTAAAKCKAEEEGFERDCARAWVSAGIPVRFGCEDVGDQVSVESRVAKAVLGD